MPESKSYFPRIAFVAIAANLFLTLAQPFKGDQNFWLNWIHQLQTNGYANFTGNYPPVYIHWLWVVGKIFSALHLTVEQGFALKFFCLWPVYAAHILLLRILFRTFENRPWRPGTKQAILWACAINPALLLDGPTWGQVDLFPAVFVAASLGAIFSKRFRHWSIPLYVIALLSKFQTVAFLPVLAALYFRYYKRVWKGIPLAVGAILLVLAPLLITGSTKQFLINAYINVVDTFPYSTDNAANLWMLLAGNQADVNSVPFLHQVNPTHFLFTWLTCNHFGKMLFCLLSLGVFAFSFRVRRLSQAASLATLMGFGFFFLLPEMHERYLVATLPVLLLWLASNSKALPWALPITAVATLNVMMLHGVQGDDLWKYLSILSAFPFVFLLLKTLVSGLWVKLVTWANRIPSPLWLPEVALVISLCICTVFGVLPMRPKILHLDSTQVWVESLAILDGGELNHGFTYDKSIGGHELQINGSKYLNGIGTQAPARISFALPPNAQRFQAKVGIDQEATSGSLNFIVLLDDMEIWRSPELTKSSGLVDVDLNVHGGKLTLATVASTNMDAAIDALDDDNTNSADWIQPRITNK